MKSWAARTLLALVMAMPSAPAAALAAGDFAGTYDYVGPIGESASLQAAVQQTTELMNPLVRAVAKMQLTKATAIPKTLIITLAGSLLSLQTPPRPSRTTPVDGKPVIFRGPDRTSSITRRLDRHALIEVAAASDGAKTAAYRLYDGGRRLVVQIHIESFHFQTPLAYHLTYRRR